MDPNQIYNHLSNGNSMQHYGTQQPFYQHPTPYYPQYGQHFYHQYPQQQLPQYQHFPLALQPSQHNQDQYYQNFYHQYHQQAYQQITSTGQPSHPEVSPNPELPQAQSSHQIPANIDDISPNQDPLQEDKTFEAESDQHLSSDSVTDEDVNLVDVSPNQKPLQEDKTFETQSDHHLSADRVEDEDLNIDGVLLYLSAKKYPSNSTKSEKSVIRRKSKNFQLENGTLY